MIIPISPMRKLAQRPLTVPSEMLLKRRESRLGTFLYWAKKIFYPIAFENNIAIVKAVI